MATIFRIYTLYRPLKTFFAIGTVLMLLGVVIGARFLWFYVQGDRGGHIQSLILGAVFLITGFHTWLIALLADLIAAQKLRPQIAVEAPWREVGTVARQLIDREFTGKAVLHVA